MQQHQLTSNQLRVLVNNAGAEIVSVRNGDGLEYIWQSNKTIWARHAPVLFPIVGKLKENSFLFNQQNYFLSQHGFARDMDFVLNERTSHSCLFELTSTPETKKNYPFDFTFHIGYQLESNTLTTRYNVFNPSSEAIYFSVGAHPGFNCPLMPTEKYEDYYLEFESSTFAASLQNGGLITDAKSSVTLENNKLFLSPSLFQNDALVFENNQINRVSLCSSVSDRKVTLNCEHWPYFGIWTKKDCREFICLEPWYGIADRTSSGQLLVEKDGIIKLEAKREFSCDFSIIFN
jgi:galactose mutarotase-like enzyme